MVRGVGAWRGTRFGPHAAPYGPPTPVAGRTAAAPTSNLRTPQSALQLPAHFLRDRPQSHPSIFFARPPAHPYSRGEDYKHECMT